MRNKKFRLQVSLKEIKMLEKVMCWSMQIALYPPKSHFLPAVSKMIHSLSYRCVKLTKILSPYVHAYIFETLSQLFIAFLKYKSWTFLLISGNIFHSS